MSASYLAAHEAHAVAEREHADALAGGASASMVLETRYRMEATRRVLNEAKAAVMSAAWASGRMEKAMDLGKAVEFILASTLAEARAQARSAAA